MSLDETGRRATRIAKVVFDMAWWVGLGLGGILAVLFVLAPVLLTNESGMNTVGVQVSIAEDSLSKVVPLTSPDTLRAARPVLEERTQMRHLEFDTRHVGFFYIVNLWILLAVAAGLLGLHVLRSFLADVLATEVFTARNAQRLSRLAWLAIVAGFASPLMEYWRSWMILKHTQLSGVGLAPASSGDGQGSIAAGVLLLVLASAWRYGAELQQERDLTV